ncbi:MAG: GWxTD domain-containing protein [Candidatus Aminicenantes bacterium]|nr:GWxTD domain-containing protein [Candidatus Aminicenantes bacterium]
MKAKGPGLRVMAAAGAAAAWLGASVPFQDKLPPSARHQEFLQVVSYIITPSEKSVFEKLSNDRDRDIFVESFWKFRDPTPGTPENEFREEHLRRWNHANKVLGRGTGRPGWMTDRGRYYIILGEPNSYDRFPGTSGIVPCEVWYYYTDGSKGLPTHFGLVFFQKAGIGEYKLYDPVVDGPKALLLQTPEVRDIAPEDYETLYDTIAERAPTLAERSISLVPGEFGFGYQPTPRNTMLIAQILESPRADINPAYATHFLDYKGLVSTEYMSNYIDAETAVAVLRDPVFDLPFIHFSMRPARVSADYARATDQYYCAFSVSVSLRIPGRTPEELVFQSTKDLPFYFPPSEEARVRANGVAVEDVFPAAAGTYRLIILLQNAVGKEFSLHEQDITIPDEESGPFLAGPYFGYRFQDYGANLLVPFKVLEKKLVVDPRNTFARQDTVAMLCGVTRAGRDLWQEGLLRTTFLGASGKPEARKTTTVRLRDFPYGPSIPVTQTLAARDLPADYYDVEIILVDGRDAAVAAAKGRVVISPAEAIGHPIARAKGFPLEGKYLLFGALAQQYAKTGAAGKADASYQQAFALKPDFYPGWADYARFLARSGRFDEAMAAAEKFKAESGLQFEYFAVRGKALAGKGDFPAAVEALLAANRVYNSDLEVLNGLGFCYLRLGKKKEALDALQASLKLRPDQAEAKSLLAEAEKLRRP